jgi:formamidopyrimidine-DNA glycosylase
MPELPEAITISSQLKKYLVNSILRKVDVKRSSIVKGVDIFKLLGSKCIDVGNYGKMVYFKLLLEDSKDYWVVFHLALTGYLVVNPSDVFYKYSVVEFFFDDNVVIFGAKRMFEKMIVYDVYPFSKYGRDFRSIDPKDFINVMTKKNSIIKVALMDQSLVAGIGNIYACEALFDSGISPTRYTKNLTVQEYYKLYKSLKDILSLAVEKRGSTISDYVDAFGQRGEFQNYHKIYGKKRCPNCNSNVKVIRIQDRITYYCPNCQR